MCMTDFVTGSEKRKLADEILTNLSSFIDINVHHPNGWGSPLSLNFFYLGTTLCVTCSRLHNHLRKEVIIRRLEDTSDVVAESKLKQQQQVCS